MSARTTWYVKGLRTEPVWIEVSAEDRAEAWGEAFREAMTVRRHVSVPRDAEIRHWREHEELESKDE